MNKKLLNSRIGHDNSGISPAWHLKQVKINTPQGESYDFPCKRWFDKYEDDGLIERVLYPENVEVHSKEKSRSQSRDSSRSRHNGWFNCCNLYLIFKSIITFFLLDENAPYKVIVKTSKKFGSGTDAKVHIKLNGEFESTDRIPLNRSLTHKNPFESGNEDVFEVVAPNLGALTKIR